MISQPVKLGLIGLKGINKSLYFPAFVTCGEAKLVGGVDLSPEARTQFTENCGLPAFATMTDMAQALDIDGVLIGTPNTAHLPNVREALSHGWHLSVTKPLCNSVAECAEAIRLAAAAGKVLQVSHEYRLRPAVRRALELACNGEMGAITMATAHLGHSGGLRGAGDVGQWRNQSVNAPGGCLNLLGVHMFDVLNALFGRPLAVTARLGRLVTSAELEDTAAAIVEYTEGRLGVVTASYASVPSDLIHIFGTTGNALITGSGLILEREPKPWQHTEVPDESLPQQGSGEMVLRQFCAAIRKGAGLETPGEAGLLAVALNEAALTSQREGGRRVQIEELF